MPALFKGEVVIRTRIPDSRDIATVLRELEGELLAEFNRYLERHFQDYGFQRTVLRWPDLVSERERRRIASGERRAMLHDTGRLAGSSEIRSYRGHQSITFEWIDTAGYGIYHARGSGRLPVRNPYVITRAEWREVQRIVADELGIRLQAAVRR